MHRVGDHGVKEGPNRRRCLTVEEMLALRSKDGNPRLKQNARGVWVGWSDRWAPEGGDRRARVNAAFDEIARTHADALKRLANQ
jgi:hypothetical protein